MTTDKNANEMEMVRQLYRALNHNEIPDIVKLLDPQILRVEFEGTSMAGTFRGLDEVRTHFIKGRATWAEGACEPEKMVAVGNKVIVSVHVRVRLKDKTEWLEGRVTDVFAFGNGKIIEFRSFEKSEDAMKWANS